MHYLVTIGYESEQQDKNGNTKIQKEKYIFEGESVEEVTMVAAEYCSGDQRHFELLSIVKMPIQCVVDKKNTPEYYK
jgi:hypothetical protein